MNEPDAAFWQRQYERQKQARKEAEFLLESKSKEIYAAHKNLQFLIQNLENHIRDRTERLEDLSQVFLSLSTDPQQNIQLLTEAAGKFLSADHALYYRLESEEIRCRGVWHATAVHELENRTETQLATSIINSKSNETVLFSNLKDFDGDLSGKMTSSLGLITGFAHPVFLIEGNIGAIICFYRTEFVPSQDDKVILGLVASAISKEEKRYQTLKEKRQIELSLEEKEAEAEQFFTLAPELLFIANTEGVFYRLNPAWNSVLGYAEKDLVGQHFLERVHPQDLDSTRDSIRKLLDTGKAQSFANRYCSHDGTYRWIEWRTSIHSGKLIYAIARDISQQEELKTTLIKAKESAEHAATAKSLFLANMSHEIRTPLNGIISMNRLMLESDLPDGQLKYAEAVQTSATSLLGILNDILDISKVEAGELELENCSFSLFEIIDGVVDLTQIRAENAGLQYVVCYDPNLPDHLIGDPSRLRQILLNIITNAIKFTSEGSITIHINYHESTSDSCHLQFEISDTGPGISKTIQKHLFEPFKQGDSSINRKYGGTGLGLSICKALVEKMEGSISVHSDEGKGSTFSFKLPFGIDTKFDASRKHSTMGKQCGQCIVTSTDPLRRKALTNLMLLTGTTPLTSDSFPEACDQLQSLKFNTHITWILDTKSLDPVAYGELERLAKDRSKPLTLLLVSDSTSKVEKGSFRFYEFESIVFPNRRSDFIRRLCRICQIPCDTTPYGTQRRENINISLREGAKVLLAEDNKINQLACRTTMKNMGFTVDIAENGHEVLRKLETDTYDLILMDINMPEMDGLEATRAIRSSGSKIPIVALTANAMKGDREKFLECGMDDYLSKPLMMEPFVQVLNRVLKEKLSSDRHVVAIEAKSPESNRANPVVLWENLVSKLGGDTHLIQLLLGKFDEELKKNSERAFRAIDSGDIQQAISCFHLLSGSAATLEIPIVQSRAKDLEQYLRKEALGPQLNPLIERFQESVKQWKQWYSIHKSAS